MCDPGRPGSWSAGQLVREHRGPHAVLRQGHRAECRTPPPTTKKEIIRPIAEISMGGTLAMIGGTVVIVGFLTLAAGWNDRRPGIFVAGQHRVEALTGFLAAFINVRISAPVVAGIGLAATFGAGDGATRARCGSTRRSTPWSPWASVGRIPGVDPAGRWMVLPIRRCIRSR